MFLVPNAEPQKPRTLNAKNQIIYEHKLGLNPAMAIHCSSECRSADKHSFTSQSAEFPGEFVVAADPTGQQPRVGMLCCPPLAVPTPGCWQELYLTQPPVVAVKMQHAGLSGQGERRDHTVSCIVWNPSGVTLGDVMAIRGKVHVQLAGDLADGSLETFVNMRVDLRQDLAGKGEGKGPDSGSQKSSDWSDCDIISEMRVEEREGLHQRGEMRDARCSRQHGLSQSKTSLRPRIAERGKLCIRNKKATARTSS